ncbi:MAG: Rne/Rng family ribonuclease, partial [Bosea sp. (in: a-proteobacteria)]
AKVTRVEPSLQAAFVEYGGNRHGFLAFAEIHPDYYQIPVADRQALIAADAAASEDDEREEERREKRGRGGRNKDRGRGRGRARSARPDVSISTDAVDADGEAASENASQENDAELTAADSSENEAPQAEQAADDAQHADENGQEDESNGAEHNADEAHHEEQDQVEQVGGDAMDDVPDRPRQFNRRQYKIQEVIKRRQIILVQVVKEERGNKGAALTTYLSLAGRYSVLMPNTGKGGGISRKITNAEDRKRLKEIAHELEVPEGMGLILRTAGASRTKVEIKRDYEYLMRMWESVRELTLSSSAPALVYEEGNLVKRSIRDLYNKDIDEVHVAGESAYREAKDFMRMLMPSHAKSVKNYHDDQPLFARYGVESQLDAMFSHTVTLKSGGYIVINQTEALVAIDINSGRSTREHNIEDTALKTNLEAADEIARQLRLRDLAGLIVIDFIDMEEHRNNRAVEKKMKDCLKDDRARIQVGRISAFGLLEMSRQRIRTGVLESSSIPCPHCAGTGMLRSPSSVALQILRALEETLIKSNSHHLTVRTRPEVALYVLNQKRAHLRDLETRFGVTVMVLGDGTIMGQKYFDIERGEFIDNATRVIAPARPAAIIDDEDDALDAAAMADAEAEEQELSENTGNRGLRQDSENGENGEGGESGEASRRRKRRRRRRRGGERDNNGNGNETNEASDSEQLEGSEGEEGDAEASGENATSEARSGEDGESRRRRRGRRGGRRNRGERGEGEAGAAEGEDNGAIGELVAEPVAEVAVVPEPEPEALVVADKPKRASRSRKKVVETAEPETVAAEPVVAAPEPVVEPEPVVVRVPEPEPVAVVLTPPDPDRPKRGGWWSRK